MHKTSEKDVTCPNCGKVAKETEYESESGTKATEVEHKECRLYRKTYHDKRGKK